MRTWLIVGALVAIGGCKKFDFPDLPDFDVSLPLPKDAKGNYKLFEDSEGGLSFNPTRKDAITALGRCADMLTNCYDPANGRPLDECVAEAPVCETKEPWLEDECCPKACADAYDKARKKGTDEIAAFEQVYFLDPDCFPGVKALLEAK